MTINNNLNGNNKADTTGFINFTRDGKKITDPKEVGELLAKLATAQVNAYMSKDGEPIVQLVFQD